MSGLLGAAVRTLRGFTEHIMDEEPKWRRRGHELTTGYQPHW
jgi:hydrogenase small subunit